MDKLDRIKIPAVVEDEKMDIIYDAIKNGGGGGGGAFETLELKVDYDNNVISTVKTVREIIDLYTQGKVFVSSLVMDPSPQSLICLQVFYGTLVYLGDDGYSLAGFTHSPEDFVRLDFGAPESLDAVFTAQLPN